MERGVRSRSAEPGGYAGEAAGYECELAEAEETRLCVLVSADEDIATEPDHFVEREGLRYAGTHLIIDLWDASRLDDVEEVEAALRGAAEAGKATLLTVELHSFAPTGGITGVAILAESHISIHTWPERSYAAVDVFMCGRAEPHNTVDVLRRAFEPATLTLVEHKRGLMP